MQDAHRPAGRRAGHFSRTALLAASVAIVASSFDPVQVAAQVLDPLRGYGFDGSPLAGAPSAPQRAARPRDNGYRDEVAAPRPTRQQVAVISPSRIRSIAAQEGYRLSTLPHRRGRSYFALAENNDGHRFELMFNAVTGTIVAQRDLGPAKGEQPAPVVAAKTPDAKTPASVEVAAEPAGASEVSPDIVAARAEVERAAAAEAEARQLVEARAAENHRAQVKLALAEAAAHRIAEAHLQEARRQAALLVEQKRNEERTAENKRRALAAADAKLAQAKAIQARADAEMKKAEAEAAAARAAIAPAEMAHAAPKASEMAPSDDQADAGKPETSKTAEALGRRPAESAAAEPAKTDLPSADKAAKAETSKSEASGTEPAQAAESPAVVKSAESRDVEAKDKDSEIKNADTASPATAHQPASGGGQQAAVYTVDPTPTGSTAKAASEPARAPTAEEKP